MKEDQAARSRGYAHAYHEAVITGILARAHGYVHRPRRHLATGAGGRSARRHELPVGKGDEIRARIAANAQKRFEIAEAMKAEAGVRAHDLTGERDGGIAWTDRARILAPAGENRVQLATLAHECGHVFLHSPGSPGYYMPGHVKELEAECYAHQAFAAHGMRMPSQITNWGRAYVGQWVTNDRAVGIPIDPRAEAYAAGKLSPFTPLRAVPLSWRLSRSPLLQLPETVVFGDAVIHKQPAHSDRLRSWFRKSSLAALARLHSWLPVDRWWRRLEIAFSRDGVEPRPVGGVWFTLSLVREFGELLALAGYRTMMGWWLIALLMSVMQQWLPPELELLGKDRMPTLQGHVVAAVGGLWLSCLPMAWTVRRRFLASAHRR